MRTRPKCEHSTHEQANEHGRAARDAAASVDAPHDLRRHRGQVGPNVQEIKIELGAEPLEGDSDAGDARVCTSQLVEAPHHPPDDIATRTYGPRAAHIVAVVCAHRIGFDGARVSICKHGTRTD